jgi:dephospho-CoA kinase
MSIQVFGLTGGIGSGKSTVARRFRARGLPVIDADALAREVVAKGSDGLAELVRCFGEEILTPGGELDRPGVARRVFGDAEALRALNAITHPRVAALAAERTRALEEQGEALACYEVPLLFEGRFAEAFRPIVVVVVPVEVQIARTLKRDGTTHADVQARIDAQIPLSKKAALADFIIDNSGELEETFRQADDVLDAICRNFGVPKERYLAGPGLDADGIAP